MDSQTTFLSCDWGTSSFRLRLVERAGLNVLAEASSKEGNAATAELWQQANQPAEQRMAFYLGIVRKHLTTLEKAVGTSLKGVPVVMSGMASSTIGMMELPYKALPFATDGADLATKTLAPTADFAHPVLLISGVKSEADVMRGEEVQLVGCGFETSDEEQLFLHPGTHAKHVRVRAGQAVAFETYMTGELFSLLSKESILAASVEEGGRLEEANHRHWFEQGVRASQHANLLHNAFMVRTNDLFGKASKRENYFYLSGLVIGSECRDLLNNLPASIVLAGEAVLINHYCAALHALGIAEQCPIETKTAVEVTLRGQLEVLNYSALSQPH
ncbi:2-dehydro-3-deoxygalactonokinase [Hymenobacter glacialis]|uniref:2-keto-3-deoxy-galactonokinase n=1 Tax=Hymenobacter glacialis TaxID=1908236 RepID=A0A1G1SYZ1_9BACT|nr:2-dehydro-3-deoxygalactonokinase [Hymenobacter glacialis]OGX83837.1 hypothetical protein BEN48_03485 [Hymenobacter glacialis]